MLFTKNNNPASWITSQTNKELTLLNANLGTWNYKHKFLSQKFGESSRFVHFVRDPRSWINAIMWQNKLEAQDRQDILNNLIQNYVANVDESKLKFESTGVSLSSLKNATQIRILAHIWQSNLENILQQEEKMPPGKFTIVRMEDIFNDAQRFTVKMTEFTGNSIKLGC